jgi:hypothetical protein
MLLHRGETHAVSTRERRDRLRLLFPDRALKDVPPSGRAERVEDAIGLLICELIYNHMVVSYLDLEPAVKHPAERAGYRGNLNGTLVTMMPSSWISARCSLTAMRLCSSRCQARATTSSGTTTVRVTSGCSRLSASM